MENQYSYGALYQPDPRQPYNSLPNIHGQVQHTSTRDSHILPPLQAQQSALDFGNASFDQAGRPLQPFTPTNGPRFDEYASQRPRQQLPLPAFTPAYQSYSNISPGSLQQSQPLSYEQFSQQSASSLPTDPRQNFAQLTGAQLQLSDLPPLAHGGFHMPGEPSSISNDPNSCSSIQTIQRGGDSDRTHVVGSQGRRGVLPSTAGRPAALPVEGNASNRTAVVPVKDAEGKYPCPFCNKTYLHAKHLKRHLLRHSGDRPYTCFLCKDTFSRSDILKRHFQKCSLRRGNPTGATHLSNQSHSKKKTGRRASVSVAGEENFLDVTPTPMSAQGTGFDYPDNFGLGIQGPLAGYQSVSQPVSRSGSIQRNSDTSMTQDKHRSTGSVSRWSKRASFASPVKYSDSNSMPSTTASTPIIPRHNGGSGYLTSTHSSQFKSGQLPQLPTISANKSSVRNSLPHLPSPSNSFGASFDSTITPNYMRTSFSTPNLPELFHSYRTPQRQESMEDRMPITGLPLSHNDDYFCGPFNPPNTICAPPQYIYQGWNLQHAQMESFQMKAQQLLQFCLTHGGGNTAYTESENDLLRYCLTGESIQHLLEQYAHFQGHWPIIHMPTFDPIKAYDGLLLAMICIGAVYSNRMDAGHVRILISRARMAIQQASIVIRVLRAADYDPHYLDNPGSTGFEDLQGLVLIHTLSIWHGDPALRQSAREEYSCFAEISRRYGLLQPTPIGSPSASVLHQPSSVVHSAMDQPWDWLAWVRQERRSRLMYTIFLMNAALAIYFNCTPQLDPSEIMLPLPADDAAWEAANSQECAMILGVHGSTTINANIPGSRRMRQLEMHTAMQILLHPNYEFEKGSTNAFSKFILIHGLHIKIFNFQRQASGGENNLLGIDHQHFFGSGSNTPISPTDWVTLNNPSSHTSTTTSGQATPTDSSGVQTPAIAHLLKSISIGLSKWKKTWDADLPLQYPPGSKRVGFCRDGIHFYWLAILFMKMSRAVDWQTPSDIRFRQVMVHMKSAKNYVTRTAVPGEENGSVADIDERYGLADLSLDMKELFTPLASGYCTPVSGVTSSLKNL